jgi:hypothetical protein
VFYYTANVPGIFGLHKKKVIFPGFQYFTGEILEKFERHIICLGYKDFLFALK